MPALCLPSTTLGRSDGGLRKSNSFWILMDVTYRATACLNNLGWARASLRLKARKDPLRHLQAYALLGRDVLVPAIGKGKSLGCNSLGTCLGVVRRFEAGTKRVSRWVSDSYCRYTAGNNTALISGLLSICLQRASYRKPDFAGGTRDHFRVVRDPDTIAKINGAALLARRPFLPSPERGIAGSHGKRAWSRSDSLPSASQ